MLLNIPNIPDKTNAFSVQFPIEHVKGEWGADYHDRFSDACFALECDGWKEVRFSQREDVWLPSAPIVPLLFMRPEWAEPQIKTTAEVRRGESALYWKPTGIAKELLYAR